MYVRDYFRGDVDDDKADTKPSEWNTFEISL